MSDVPRSGRHRAVRDGIGPAFVITHRIPLPKADKAYDIFVSKKDRCIKVVLDPTR